MTRNLKALGLALIAVFAMSAIAAQGASATTHTLTSDAANTDLTGDNIGNFVFESGSGTKIVCADAKFTGTQTGTAADQIRLTPSFGDCKLGDVSIALHDNGCEFVFDSDTNVDGHAAVDLDCDHTGSLTTTLSGCVVHFSDTHTGGGDTVNQDLTGVTYQNDDGDVDSTDDLTIDFTIAGTRTEGTGLGCAAIGWSGTKTNGKYSGKVTLRGYTDNSDHSTEDHVGIRISTP